LDLRRALSVQIVSPYDRLLSRRQSKQRNLDCAAQRDAPLRAWRTSQPAQQTPNA
jgi:hypothetical protein